jgi:DNA gyrase subunit A
LDEGAKLSGLQRIVENDANMADGEVGDGDVGDADTPSDDGAPAAE